MVVEKGDSVAVDYVGYLEGGAVFDTSIKAEAEKAGLPLRPSYAPLEFVAGAGQMIKGFDDAVIGMAEGEQKTIHLEPAEAYGERDEQRVLTVPKANIDGEISVGAKLSSPQLGVGTITEVGDENVKIDFNHELAGKALNFNLTVKNVSKSG